jgi:hypothetical protein
VKKVEILRELNQAEVSNGKHICFVAEQTLEAGPRRRMF